MRRENEIYLNSLLSELGPEALAKAAGLNSFELAKSQIRVHTVSRPGLHPVGVVQITTGSASAYVFAKVQREDYRGAQIIEREFHFLSDVAPLISAKNPALRSPRPLAYYPQRGLLLMEFVPGHSLKRHLFDINFDFRAKPGIQLPDLLHATGQWLGHLHSSTVQSARGNPLEWLLHEFSSLRTREVFLRYSQKNSYNEMLSILRRSIDGAPNFSRNLCMVHGEFTPIHVMVSGEAIYVVDFGYSRLGYPYEDVGLFTGFYDCLLPWRTVVGDMRIRLGEQKRLFLKGYFERAPASFGPADSAIMRWVRMISSARMLHTIPRRSDGFGKWAYSRLGQYILGTRFAMHCHEEVALLRKIPPGVFDEVPQAERDQPAI